MSPHDQNHVPAHGRDKDADPEDPLRLEGAVVEGNPVAMLEGLVEEFARMGMPAEQIHGLFSDPNFRATSGLVAAFGAEVVKEKVNAVLARSGVWRVTVTETTTCSDNCSIHDASGGLHHD